MPWTINWKQRFFGIQDEDKGDKGGGGGGGPSQKDFDEIKSQNAKLLERLDALEKKNAKPDPETDPDLAGKARKELEDKQKKETDNKSLEAAIRFSLGSKDFVKLNEAFLPKTIQGIFDQAEKEKYDSPVEKDSVIKSNIVKEFFSIQSNVDLLTQAQKAALEDFLKLTETAKKERAQNIYDTIFEPTLQAAKAIEKAKQLNNGTKTQSDGEKALAEKMMKLSRKHYLGEKENA